MGLRACGGPSTAATGSFGRVRSWAGVRLQIPPDAAKGVGDVLPIRCPTCDMESGEAFGVRNGAAGLRWSVYGSRGKLRQE
jgi:hypothetical protein